MSEVVRIVVDECFVDVEEYKFYFAFVLPALEGGSLM